MFRFFIISLFLVQINSINNNYIYIFSFFYHIYIYKFFSSNINDNFTPKIWTFLKLLKMENDDDIIFLGIFQTKNSTSSQIKIIQSKDQHQESKTVLIEKYSCKICFDRLIDTCLVPCGHALCDECLIEIKNNSKSAIT